MSAKRDKAAGRPAHVLKAVNRLNRPDVLEILLEG